MKRIKRMKRKKGATFLAERYYLSRSLQPPFSGNIHQICYPIGRTFIVTQMARISQILCSIGWTRMGTDIVNDNKFRINDNDDNYYN